MSNSYNLKLLLFDNNDNIVDDEEFLNKIKNYLY